MPPQMNFVSFYHETTALSSIFISVDEVNCISVDEVNCISVDEVNCISVDEVNEMPVGINPFSSVSTIDLFNLFRSRKLTYI